MKRQAGWHDDPLSFFHYRDKDQVEVDIVIERGALSVAGVEVKAAATVTPADFRGLRKLKKRPAGPAIRRWGWCCTMGETDRPGFGDGLYARPHSADCGNKPGGPQDKRLQFRWFSPVGGGV